MPNITNKDLLQFEKTFLGLMQLELIGNVSIKELSSPFVKKLLDDFYFNSAREVLADGNNAFYFFEIICHPYTSEVDLSGDGWEWAKNLFNHTLNKIAIERVENTLSLSLVRVFYILWYGIQTKTLDEELLSTHFAEIWGFFDTAIPVPLITYSFLVKHYPSFDDENTKDALRLLLMVEHPTIVDKVFDC